MTSQIELAIGLICTCLPTMDEYLKSRKSLMRDSQRSQPNMRFINHSFLNISKFRPQRLNTPESAAPAASHAAPGIQAERDTMITGAYSPETSPRPPSYCFRPSAIISYAPSSTSLESVTLNTTAILQAKEAPPPIPEKSSARLSLQRRSWGPATTLASYMDSATQAAKTRAVEIYDPEPRFNSSLQEKEWLPCFPSPLFAEVGETPPRAEAITPASSTSSAQHSPRMLRLSPHWNHWPLSPTTCPSPPMSPIQELLQSLRAAASVAE